jgi:isochorismate synthase EntC
MELPSWFDDEFFKLGCFCPLSDGHRFLFAKGGSWSQLPEKGETLFLLRDFYQTERWYYHPRDLLVLTKDELPSATVENQKIDFVHSDDESFKLDFNRLQSQWSESLQKVVLTSRKSFTIQDPLRARRQTMLKSLRAPIGLAYGFWKDDYALIGVTPEILFELSGKDFTTMALAGTATKEKAQDLLSSEKDRKEHELVVKNILEDLASYCDFIQRASTDVSPYGRLVHLRTLIKARLKDGHGVEELIDRLSPTAALGGYPRSNALRFLKQTNYYKNHPHRYHGSVFCFRHEGVTRALVMIRNVQLHRNELILEAGAGIIPQSDHEKELQEIHQKQLAVKELLL